MRDYYYILGVNENAELSEIKVAYRRLAKKFHPDNNLGDKYFEERFKEIQTAYELLSDSTRRAEYDTLLKKFRESKFDSNYLNKMEEELRNKYEEEFKRKAQEFNRMDKERAKSAYNTSTRPNEIKSSTNKYSQFKKIGLAFIVVLIMAILFIIVSNKIEDEKIKKKREKVESGFQYQYQFAWRHLNNFEIDSVINFILKWENESTVPKYQLDSLKFGLAKYNAFFAYNDSISKLVYRNFDKWYKADVDDIDYTYSIYPKARKLTNSKIEILTSIQGNKNYFRFVFTVAIRDIDSQISEVILKADNRILETVPEPGRYAFVSNSFGNPTHLFDLFLISLEMKTFPAYMINSEISKIRLVSDRGGEWDYELTTADKLMIKRTYQLYKALDKNILDKYIF